MNGIRVLLDYETRCAARNVDYRENLYFDQSTDQNGKQTWKNSLLRELYQCLSTCLRITLLTDRLIIYMIHYISG